MNEKSTEIYWKSSYLLALQISCRFALIPQLASELWLYWDKENPS